MTNEQHVFESQISPLLEQINNICVRNQMSLIWAIQAGPAPHGPGMVPMQAKTVGYAMVNVPMAATLLQIAKDKLAQAERNN